MCLLDTLNVLPFAQVKCKFQVKCVITQVKCASTQVHKYSNVQIHAQVHTCTNTQVCKYLRMYASEKVLVQVIAQVRKCSQVRNYLHKCTLAQVLAQVLGHLRTFGQYLHNHFCASTQVCKYLRKCLSKNLSKCTSA